MKTLKSFKVRDFKCFPKEADFQGFDDIKRINILIGKNNSGKSKILEALRRFVIDLSNRNQLPPHTDLPHQPDYKLSFILTPALVNHVGAQSIIHNSNKHKDEDDLGLIGRELIFSRDSVTIPDYSLGKQDSQNTHTYDQLTQRFGRSMLNPFQDYHCLCVDADRDIKSEHRHNNPNPDSIFGSGQGITGLVAHGLTHSVSQQDGRTKIIEEDLLEKLNEVLRPDVDLDRISAKEENSGLWEIYLHPKNRDAVKLSDCGSGLKTVLFVLACLHVIPKLRPNHKFIFMFEELENNLHPSLERRLLTHIREYIALNTDHYVFMTTHSNVTIDLFGRDENVSFSVTSYANGKAEISPVTEWSEKCELLDDLGIKASDLLQSNCIIWVEGPSDRIYFNKWIELYSYGQLKQGLHYQFAYHSGSNLSSHTASPEEDNDFVNMLFINKNAVIIMDSDKKSKNSRLKPRVKRVKDEAEKNGRSFVWVTKGREIENYIPSQCIVSDSGNLETLGLYQSAKEAFGKNYNKVAVARKMTQMPGFTLVNLKQCHDWNQQMKRVYDFIKQSNSLH